MKGTFLAFISISLFSLYFVFGKLLLNDISPFLILVVNQTLAALIILFILDLVRKIKELKNTSKRDIKIMFLISVFASILGPLLLLLGLSITSATNSILIGKSEAILTSLLAIFVLKDRITLHQIAGAVIMFTGVLIIATNNFSIGMSLNVGDALIFLSALSFAVGTILFKKYMHHIPPEVIVTLRNMFGASILFMLSLFLVDYSILFQVISIRFALALLGLVVLTTILGQYLWYKALEMTTATNVSLAGLSSPLVAVFYAVVLLGETLVRSQIIGGLFIFAGLVILEFHFREIHTPEKHKHHLKLRNWPHI